MYLHRQSIALALPIAQILISSSDRARRNEEQGTVPSPTHRVGHWRLQRSTLPVESRHLGF
jgi:hypothetical protein